MRVDMALKCSLRHSVNWTTAGLLAVYAALGAGLLLQDYLIVDGMFLVGGALAPYLFIVRQRGVYSFRYALPAVFFGGLWLLAPVKTFQYLTFAFSLLLLLESRFGKLNLLPIGWLLVLSPVSRYATDVFGFPIRLQLSKWAGQLLGATGQSVVVQGNLIIRAGQQFAVDPACVGLQLTHTACLVALFLLAHYERQTGRWLRNGQILLALGATGGLVILANLIRIVLLVQFAIPPGHVAHDLVGMICLIVYVLLPTGLLYRWLYRRWGKNTTPANAFPAKPALYSALPVLLLGLFLGQSLLVGSVDKKQLVQPAFIPAYQLVDRADGIVQYRKPTALLYVKPIAAFYSTEHSPLICWRGSGYAFKQIQQRQVAGTMIYVGKLAKGKAVLYTAWWFDNGQAPTSSQWEWRWRMLRGQRAYQLMNVTAADEKTLHEEATQLLARE